MLATLQRQFLAGLAALLWSLHAAAVIVQVDWEIQVPVQDSPASGPGRVSGSLGVFEVLVPGETHTLATNGDLTATAAGFETGEFPNATYYLTRFSSRGEPAVEFHAIGDDPAAFTVDLRNDGALISSPPTDCTIGGLPGSCLIIFFDELATGVDMAELRFLAQGSNSQTALPVSYSFTVLQDFPGPPPLAPVNAIFSQSVVELTGIYSGSLLGDGFSLNANDSVSSIRFWGGYGLFDVPPPLDYFVVRIYGDSGADSPGQTPLYQSPILPAPREETTVISYAGPIIYEYVIQLPAPLSLDASRALYLSLDQVQRSWAWSGAGTEGGAGDFWFSGPSWTQSPGFNLAFDLEKNPELLFSQPIMAEEPIYTTGNGQADDFQLNADGVATRVRFWGGYGLNAPPDHETFTIKLYTDAGGVPEAVPFRSHEGLTASRAPSPVTGLSGTERFVYDLVLPEPLSLTTGVRYYFSVAQHSSAWAWSGAGQGDHWFNVPPWVIAAGNDRNLAFELRRDPEADLGIELLTAADTVDVDQTLSLAMRVRNLGVSAATSVASSLTFADQLTYQSVTTRGALSCALVNGTLECEAARLEPGESSVALATVTANAPAQAVTSNASVQASEADPVGANDQAAVTITTQAVADLVLGACTGGSQVHENDAFTITCPVTNNGPQDAANISVSLALPLALQFTSGTQCMAQTNAVVCERSLLAAGATVNIAAELLAGMAGGYNVDIEVSADTRDPAAGGETGQHAVTVVAPPPPPAPSPPPPQPPSGGGGGGAVGPVTLVSSVCWLGWLMRRRVRQGRSSSIVLFDDVTSGDQHDAISLQD